MLRFYGAYMAAAAADRTAGRAEAGESDIERPIPAPVRGNLFSLRSPRKESLLAGQDKPECCLPLKQKEPTGWRGCPLTQHLQKAPARLNGAWAPVWRELPPLAATSSWPCDGPELFSARGVSRCVSKRAAPFTWFADAMRASVSPSPLRPSLSEVREGRRRNGFVTHHEVGSEAAAVLFSPSFHICSWGVWILYPRRKGTALLWLCWVIFRASRAFVRAKVCTHVRTSWRIGIIIIICY